MAMATGTVKSFNATKGFGFIQPTDGGTDVSFTSAVSSAAGCVTSTKARRFPNMYRGQGDWQVVSCQSQTSVTESSPTLSRFRIIDATMGGCAKAQKRPPTSSSKSAAAAALVEEIISDIQVSFGFRTIADD
jgi:hypothetical protein